MSKQTTNRTIDLNTPGGTAVQLLLGESSGHARILQLTAKGQTALVATLAGSRLMTTRGAVELGDANAARIREELASMDETLSITHRRAREIHAESVAEGRHTTQMRVAAEIAQIKYDEAAEAKETEWKSKGWE